MRGYKVFEFVVGVGIILVAVSLLSVSNSLGKIARDLRIIAGRYDSKPPVEDPEQLIDAQPVDAVDRAGGSF